MERCVSTYVEEVLWAIMEAAMNSCDGESLTGVLRTYRKACNRVVVLYGALPAIPVELFLASVLIKYWPANISIGTGIALCAYMFLFSFSALLSLLLLLSGRICVFRVGSVVLEREAGLLVRSIASLFNIVVSIAFASLTWAVVIDAGREPVAAFLIGVLGYYALFALFIVKTAKWGIRSGPKYDETSIDTMSDFCAKGDTMLVVRGKVLIPSKTVLLSDSGGSILARGFRRVLQL